MGPSFEDSDYEMDDQFDGRTFPLSLVASTSSVVVVSVTNATCYHPSNKTWL